MEEYKGLTISEFIEILKRFPQDAKIGTCYCDSEEFCMYASNNVTISDFDDISVKYEDSRKKGVIIIYGRLQNLQARFSV